MCWLDYDDLICTRLHLIISLSLYLSILHADHSDTRRPVHNVRPSLPPLRPTLTTHDSRALLLPPVPSHCQLYRRFDDEDLHEAWIIVPMSLRITHYSAPALAAHPDRPTIHVEGDMGGAGWVGGVEAHDDDVRRVHGAVSMLPDGSVRWSLVSLFVVASAEYGSSASESGERGPCWECDYGER